jgi:DNA-directed RNA polymerase specialized sigma subunit
MTHYDRYKQGDREALKEIFTEYKPLIDGVVTQYSDTGLPRPALELEAKRIVAKAVKAYEPDKGNLTVHLQNNLKSMFRETNKANQIYIPDARASLYRKFKETNQELQERLGREPTDIEMSEKLQIGMGDVRRLSAETGATVLNDMSGGDQEAISTYKPHAIDYTVSNLSGKLIDKGEKDVFDYTFGLNGKPILSTNQQIADKMGISEAMVRHIKNKLISNIKDNV